MIIDLALSPVDIRNFDLTFLETVFVINWTLKKTSISASLSKNRLLI